MESNVTPFRSRVDHVGRAAPASAQIHLLGMMRATGPNGEDALPQPKKTQAVFGYLCLAASQRVSRSRIAGTIWDRVSEVQARDSLRHALTELGRVGVWRLELTRETVRLDLSGCWIDVFENPEESDRLLEDLHGISSTFDQWLHEERTRYENRWKARLETDWRSCSARAPRPKRVRGLPASC